MYYDIQPFYQTSKNNNIIHQVAKRIYIKDWLELKPYEKQYKTDAYYLKICNKVKDAIVKESYITELLDDNGLNYLSCFLTSYLEDVISETNIWATFIRLHKQLYNKQLPFYLLNEYYEAEINIQDVSFLVWYFLNSVQEEEFVAPFNDLIVETALNTMFVLEDAWEDAPENNHLKQFYEINDKEDDFYAARKLIESLLFNTYLFHPDTSLKLNRKNKEIIDENKDEGISEGILIGYLQDNKDEATLTTHTTLLSLKGKEWIAEILGNNHPLCKDFLKISPKIAGLFLYKGQDTTNLFLEHIASGKKFELTKKSFDHSDDFDTVDSIAYMGIAKWKDEWWFSGIYLKLDYDPTIISEERSSLKSKMAVNFLDQKTYNAEAETLKQLEIFKEFNNGLQIAFLAADKINSFIDDYIEFYNNSFKYTKKQKAKALKKAQQHSYVSNDKEKTDFSDVSESGLVFFNPKSGVEIALDINSAFPQPQNPFFDIEESNIDVLSLLASDEFSKELAMYCVDNFKKVLPFFNKENGHVYLKDIDFLLRFWKRGSYFSKPTITYATTENS